MYDNGCLCLKFEISTNTLVFTCQNIANIYFKVVAKGRKINIALYAQKLVVLQNGKKFKEKLFTYYLKHVTIIY